MKIIISLFLLVMSFSSLANDGVLTEIKSSFSIESSIEVYPGGKKNKKKSRRGKRANKKRKKHCNSLHRNRYSG